MSSAEVENLKALLASKNKLIEKQVEEIALLQEQLKITEDAINTYASASGRPAVKPVEEPVDALPPLSDPSWVRPGTESDYVLKAAIKGVDTKTFAQYSKGPMTKKTAFFFMVKAFLELMFVNDVPQQQRAMDALVAFHGEGSKLTLETTKLEDGKVIVSFDTLRTLFDDAGFKPGPSDGYVPKSDLAKFTTKSSSKSSSKATKSQTVTEMSVSKPAAA